MMDVVKPLVNMMTDDDRDSAINFLDSVPTNPNYQGPIGKKTSRAKLIK